MENLPHSHPESLSFSALGEVYSFTVLYQTSEDFQPFIPYILALVKLAEGPMITAQLTDVDSEAVYIGMPVEMVTRLLKTEGDRGLRHYGYKFRPRFITNGNNLPENSSVPPQTAS